MNYFKTKIFTDLMSVILNYLWQDKYLAEIVTLGFRISKFKDIVHNLEELVHLKD